MAPSAVGVTQGMVAVAIASISYSPSLLFNVVVFEGTEAIFEALLHRTQCVAV